MRVQQVPGGFGPLRSGGDARIGPDPLRHDADQLAAVTRVPAGFWLLVLVLAALAGVAGAGALLVAPLR